MPQPSAVFDERALRNMQLLERLHVASSVGLALAAAMAALGLLGGRIGIRAALISGLVVPVAVFALNMVRFRLGLSVNTHQAGRMRRALEAEMQVSELFAMTDMLQAAETYEDAGAVLMATTQRMLPGYGASLYIFNHSRDRLDLARSWGLPSGDEAAAMLSPANCWALKRGKPHVNSPAEMTLCCSHHTSANGCIEIPMMACGQLHGLLILMQSQHSADLAELLGVRRMGRALADAMSLALSNIALRETLRSQSLRDPLTGLYNRRYMEDALQKFVAQGEQQGTSTAVLMFDLDNFKSLNDNYGHAKGDAVLRDVATQLVAGLRPVDVVCRYGGEELVAILPGCTLEDALKKAEQLRLRIEGLSASLQCPVSTSIGVAAVPQTAQSAADVVPVADAALYAAKRAGKNQVHGSVSPIGGKARLAAVAATASAAALAEMR